MAYRAKTRASKRPFRYVRVRYVRADFVLGSKFDNLTCLNAEFDRWQREVADRRRH